jgi:uncharacterized protein involved in outer membrane biogenesis
MPRYAKIILWGSLGLVAVLALCVALVAAFGLRYAKPWLERRATALMHRPVAVQGDLSLEWVKPQGQHGWRAWLPWPRFHAGQLRIGNPAWATPGINMAEVKEATVVLNPWTLANHIVQIPSLELEGGRFMLERQPDGKNNWRISENNGGTPAKWKFDIQKLALNDVHVRFADKAHRLDVEAALNSLPKATPEGYGIAWTARGSYNDAPASGQGQMGDIMSLQKNATPFPLHGQVKVGATTIGIAGSMTRPQALAALDVRLALAGDTMAQLYPLIGVTLPNTPAYHIEGRLSGALGGAGDLWKYENFKGVVGQSDLEGTLEYQVREPRPILTGQVQSRLLRLKDLGPLIGLNRGEADDKDDSPARTNAQGRQDAGANAPGGRVRRNPGTAARTASAQGKPGPAGGPSAGHALPGHSVNTAIWGKMDADVQFKGRQIQRNKDLPLDNVQAHVTLKDRVLSLTPLNFGMAGGTLANELTLDGRQAKIKANLTTAARHLKLKQLLPGARSMRASFGELHGDAKLSAQGNSVAELLAHSNGELKAVVSRGTISHLVLETAGLNVANIVMVKLFGDDQIVLNCLASDFSVTNGLMQVRVFRLETADATVGVTGQINLGSERLDLHVKPENKTLRIFTLRSPLYVSGTFKHPNVGVEKGPLAARAGAAVVLGAVATPLAALLPLLNLGTNDSRGCSSLMAAVKKPPKAPAAGTTRKSNSAKGKGKGKGKAQKAVPKQTAPASDRSAWPSSKALP